LIDDEQAVWRADRIINARGFPIDRELALAVAKLGTKQRAAVDAAIADLTGGAVRTVNSRDQALRWLAGKGCELPDLNKETVAKVMTNGLAPDARRFLELRQEGARASANKLDTLLACLDADDRLRGALVYHGAAPGRWSGSKFQPQNLKRPNKATDLDAAIATILQGGSLPLSVAADVSRSLIRAKPGHVLIGADFSAIESRVLAWLSGEQWKLDNYRRYDETGDPDIEPYCVTAILGVTDNHKSVCQVAGYILAKKLTRVTSRDIQSGVAAMSGLKRQEVEGICDQLESLGWLFRVPGPRRDSAHWQVNPEVHRKFAGRAAREVTERAARRAVIMEEMAECRAQKEGKA
jgi:hypothetical protein